MWQAEITLSGVRVPEENRLPGARSFKDAGRVLAGTRNAVAWGRWATQPRHMRPPSPTADNGNSWASRS